MFGCIFWSISYKELMCQITPPHAWPRFAFCVLRQIGIFVLICLFFICLLSMDYKEKKDIQCVFIRSCVLEIKNKAEGCTSFSSSVSLTLFSFCTVYVSM